MLDIEKIIIPSVREKAEDNIKFLKACASAEPYTPQASPT
jgi:hypothetical protein